MCREVIKHGFPVSHKDISNLLLMPEGFNFDYVIKCLELVFRRVASPEEYSNLNIPEKFLDRGIYQYNDSIYNWMVAKQKESQIQAN